MKFNLDMAKSFVGDDQKEQFEKLGFKFTPSNAGSKTSFTSLPPWYLNDEDIPEIEFDTLGQLISFSEQYGNLIIRKAYDWDGDNLTTIEIYNDYRE